MLLPDANYSAGKQGFYRNARGCMIAALIEAFHQRARGLALAIFVAGAGELPPREPQEFVTRNAGR
jgi:hypothetical protein